MKKIAFLAVLVPLVAVAQMRREDWNTARITHESTVYTILPDGGALISGCVRAVADAGAGLRQGVLHFCSEPVLGRTTAQRTALGTCGDHGERAWMLEARIRADAGF